YLPLGYVGPSAPSRPMVNDQLTRTGPRPERVVERIPDDRDNIEPDDAVLLIVEDDPHYGRILSDLAHDSGFKVIVATRGDEALTLVRHFRPTAVSLDIFLPDMLGWNVLSQIKQDPDTRHI